MGKLHITPMHFHILFLPRSGSHMLVNAMNHHPDLNVTHVDGGHSGKGAVKGFAIGPREIKKTYRFSPEDPKKAIFLTRNHMDRLLSYHTDLKFNGQIAYHTREPTTVHRTKFNISEANIEKQIKRSERLLKRADMYTKTLFLSYEDMTCNKDIREIPNEYVKKICDFLEIGYHPMPTDYYKPEVINA